MSSSSNSTNTLPPGAFTHGNPNLICVQAKWSDVFIFLLGNYVAHAATVVSSPGQSTATTVVSIIFALLSPARGFHLGIRTLFRLAFLGRTDLTKAARAGALVKVVRKADYARNGAEFSIANTDRK